MNAHTGNDPAPSSALWTAPLAASLPPPSTLHPPPLSPPRGFTLLEMLVVVIIMAILAGMMLYLIKVIGDRNKHAKTVRNIEAVRAAVEEFYAEYGQYPPVPKYDGEQPFRYEYATKGGMNKKSYDILKTPPYDQGPVFTFGLMSFLETRYAQRAYSLMDTNGTGGWPDLFPSSTTGQWASSALNQYVGTPPGPGDQTRDVRAIKRWEPFLRDVVYSDQVPRSFSPAPAVTNDYTNSYDTVLDGWGRDLHYKSDPPYQTYEIWSDGANTATNVDDIYSRPGG